MIKVQHINSKGQVVRTYMARDNAHAMRLEARIKATFSQGSSAQVRRPAN